MATIDVLDATGNPQTIQTLPALGQAAMAASLPVALANNQTALETVGSVASGATDSGKPVKVGGVYNSSLPSFTTGQRADAQMTSAGRLLVTLANSANSNICDVTTSADGASSGAIGVIAQARGQIFNGTSWDRLVKPNATSRLLSSAATTNGTSVKAAAGNLHRIRGVNTVASKRYLKLYNKASAPTVGTDVPVDTLVIPASAAFDFAFDARYFATGIAYAITGAAADADTTALSVGDIECLSVTYA